MSRTSLIIRLGFGLSVHGTVQADEQRWPNHAGYLVPISSFDTDDGFGGGVRFALTHQPESHVPFKSSTVFQSFMTNRGYQQHLFRWDRRGLGRDGGARLFVHLEWF